MASGSTIHSSSDVPARAHSLALRVSLPVSGSRVRVVSSQPNASCSALISPRAAKPKGRTK